MTRSVGCGVSTRTTSGRSLTTTLSCVAHPTLPTATMVTAGALRRRAMRAIGFMSSHVATRVPRRNAADSSRLAAWRTSERVGASCSPCRQCGEMVAAWRRRPLSPDAPLSPAQRVCRSTRSASLDAAPADQTREVRTSVGSPLTPYALVVAYGSSWVTKRPRSSMPSATPPEERSSNA
jgi:hypothetical protein